MAAGSSSSRRFRTGEQVPASGVYRVHHRAHRVPHEVTLVEGHTFPRCQRCDDAVLFEVVRTIHDYELKARIVLYQLPELEPEQAA